MRTCGRVPLIYGQVTNFTLPTHYHVIHQVTWAQRPKLPGLHEKPRNCWSRKCQASVHGTFTRITTTCKNKSSAARTHAVTVTPAAFVTTQAVLTYASLDKHLCLLTIARALITLTAKVWTPITTRLQHQQHRKGQLADSARTLRKRDKAHVKT